MQIVGHLLEGDGELLAMVGHALVEPMDLLVAGAVSSLSVLVAVRGVVDGTGELPQPLSMFLLQSTSFFEKS